MTTASRRLIAAVGLLAAVALGLMLLLQRYV